MTDERLGRFIKQGGMAMATITKLRRTGSLSDDERELFHSLLAGQASETSRVLTLDNFYRRDDNLDDAVKALEWMLALGYAARDGMLSEALISDDAPDLAELIRNRRDEVAKYLPEHEETLAGLRAGTKDPSECAPERYYEQEIARYQANLRGAASILARLAD